MFKTIFGKAKLVTGEMIAPWLENTQSTILSQYPLQDIFNKDEFGLFYQCVPNRTYHFKNKKSTGDKHSKVCLTGMTAGNVNGERLPMTGKSKTPRCFKGVKNVWFRYGAQPKSWISSELFEECVKEIYRNFGTQKRKIALIIDKCPAHLDVPALDCLELIVFPQIKESTNLLKQNIVSLQLKSRLIPWKKETSFLNVQC